MELMPHVKALLDDLISLTRNIVVKRSDLAIANEGDTSNTDLYYAYKKVIDGEMTYSSCIKSDIPYSVLSNIYKWEKLDIKNQYNLVATKETNVYQYKLNNNTITIRNLCDYNKDGPEIEYLKELGDIYIRQDAPTITTGVSGSFAKLYKVKNSFRYSDVSLYETFDPSSYSGNLDELTEDRLNKGIFRDPSGNIVNIKISSTPEIDNNGKIIFYDDLGEEIKLYVNDNEFGFYQEVRYKRDEEYILAEDVKSELIGMQEFIGLSASEKQELAEIILLGIAAKQNDVEFDIYQYYGGYADIDYQEFPNYLYDTVTMIDSNGNKIYKIAEYVYDNDIGRFRLKRNDVADDSLEIYYRRSYDEYYKLNEVNNIEYVKKDLQVPYYYTKVDDIDYYEILMPNIDSDGEYVKDENDLITMIGSGIYATKENLGDSFDDSMTPYTKYINNKAGIIDFDYTIKNKDDQEIKKYSNEVYKSENSNISEKTVILYTDKISEDVNCYEYYLKDKNGRHILVNYNGEDIYIPAKTGNDNTDYYSKNIVYNPFFYIKDGDTYKLSDKYVDNNTYYYYNENVSLYKVVRLFTNNDIRNIWNNKYNMNDEYAKLIMDKYCEYIKDQYAKLRNDSRWSITRYDGENNAYYRALNGLPPKDSLENQPKIDRYKINPEYDGDDPNPYLYNLSDDEVDVIVNNGMLDKIKSIYTDADYLNHLGRYRVDTVIAREAAPFDILVYGSYQNPDHFNMFNDAYRVSKNYIIHNHYQPEMFDVNEYYGSYIAMIILVHALEICMARSGDILIHNKYSDYDTVQLKLKSFGFENTFEHIPLVYRKNIAKNIELLIKNKGIDNIYDIVYKTFGIDDVEVYRYYFRRIFKQDINGNYIYKTNENGESVPDYNISMAQVPINSENVVRDIINPDNSVDYDSVTESDKYWGVYEPKSNIKKMFEEYPFNYMNSKYITLNNKFNLSSLNFSSSYYLNYVYELLGDYKFSIDIDGFDNPQDLKNLIVMLFAIQSVKYGFDGNIPNDLVGAAAVLKFNLSKEVTVTGEDALNSDTKSKLIDIIDSYYNHMTNRQTIDKSIKETWSDSEKILFETEDKLSTVALTEEYWRGKGKAKNIRNNIINGPKPPIVLPKEIKDSTALDNISEAYIENLRVNDKLTSSYDEGSLYNTILRYRDDAKNYNDYICFDKLAKLISISKVVKDYYSIDSVWEEIAKVDVKPMERNGKPYIMTYSFEPEYYINSDGTILNNMTQQQVNDKINSCWLYSDIGNVWSSIDPNSDSTFINKFSKLLSNGKLDKVKFNIKNTDMLNIYFCDDVPLLSKTVDYEYAIKIGDNKRGELLNHNFINSDGKLDFDSIGLVAFKKSTIFPENISIQSNDSKDPSLYQTKVINEWNNKGIIVSEGNNVIYAINNPEEYNGTKTINDGTYYFQIIDNKDGETCTVKVYRYTKYAYTYEMYLKYNGYDLYQYLKQRDGENKSDYISRLNELYSIIIASIENSITSNTVRDELNLSLIDFSNIVKYIKIVIDVFKSYTIDLASIDAIYTIDDKSTNRIKSVDDINIHDNSHMYSNMHSHSMVAFHEKLSVNDNIGYHDEILIEQFNVSEKEEN